MPACGGWGVHRVPGEPGKVDKKPHAFDPNDHCRLGATKDVLEGIMIGDSFAIHCTGMINIPARPDNITLMDSCQPILGYTAEIPRCRRPLNGRPFSLTGSWLTKTASLNLL